MKPLNKLRLLAGIAIDGSIEITEKRKITEARKVPQRREDLAKKSAKTMTARVNGVQSAIKHLGNAINALDKIPATDYAGDIQHYIQELEYVMKGEPDGGGLEQLLTIYQKEQRSHVRTENAKKRQEEEEEARVMADLAAEDASEEEVDEYEDETDDEYEEEKMSESTESSDELVSEMDISTEVKKGQEVWDEVESKDESPSQLEKPGETSDQDQSEYDIDAKVTVPNGIKQALRTEIEEARKEAKKMDVRDKTAAQFYNDLADVFEDLLGHLEKGTRYDIKQAQVFAQSLMGPMLHKLPTEVWKFIARGGEPRSLKSVMKDISKEYPKTGPQNVLK